MYIYFLGLFPNIPETPDVTFYDQNTKCKRSILLLYFSGPPSSIRNLQVSFRDHTSLTLTWSPPEDPGGRRDVTYEIVCQGLCSQVHYEPAQKGFNKTRSAI